MLSPQIAALVDNYVTAYDSKHPIAFKEREAKHHIRHGTRIGVAAQWEGALDQGDFVQMGRFLRDFLHERTVHIWGQLQEAIKSCELRPYPEFAADIEEYLKTKYAPHLNRVTQILNESAKQFDIPSGYVSESVRHCNIVFAELNANVDMFCAKYEADVKRKSVANFNATVSGANPRIYINSQDYSTKIANSPEVFSQIFKAISESVSGENARTELETRTREMQESVGKPTFKEKYNRWVSVAADHAQLISFAGELLKLIPPNS